MNLEEIKNKKGFSIIEILIYLAIFTVMSIVVINSFIIILSSSSTIRSNHDLLDSGSVAMERISHEIRKAKNIDLVNSVFDSNSSVLQLTDVDGTSNINFRKDGDNLDISKNGGSLGNLLAENIHLNSLIFRRIVTAQGEAVKIEIQLQDTRGKANKSANFYDTVILRGGY